MIFYKVNIGYDLAWRWFGPATNMARTHHLHLAPGSSELVFLHDYSSYKPEGRFRSHVAM